MALGGPTLLTEGFDNTNKTAGQSWATASISPTNGALVIAIVQTTTSNTAPTLSGVMTWAQMAPTSGPAFVGFDTAGTPTDRMTAFVGTGTPSAGVVTITAQALHNACLWHIFEFTGHDTTTPIPQSDDAADASAAPAATLAAFGSANNWTVIAMANDVNRTVTLEGTYALIGTKQVSESNIQAVAFLNANDTSPSMTLSGAGGDWGVLAFEVAEAAAVGDVTPLRSLMGIGT